MEDYDADNSEVTLLEACFHIVSYSYEEVEAVAQAPT